MKMQHALTGLCLLAALHLTGCGSTPVPTLNTTPPAPLSSAGPRAAVHDDPAPAPSAEEVSGAAPVAVPDWVLHPSSGSASLPDSCLLPVASLPPPLDQGPVAADAAMALGYVQNSVVVNAATPCSPAWLYAAAGNSPRAILDTLVTQGAVDAQVCPWPDPASGADAMTVALAAIGATPAPASPQYQIGSWYQVPIAWQGSVAQSMQSIQAQLAPGRPVAIRIQAPDALQTWFNTTDADVMPPTALGPSSHVMCVVGYDNLKTWVNADDGETCQGAFLVQNSQGTSFGNGGTCWMSYDLVWQCIDQAYVQMPTSGADATPRAVMSSPPAAAGGAIDSVGQAPDGDRIDLVVRETFAQPVTITGVHLTGPDGVTMSQTLTAAVQSGYLHFATRQGLLFPNGGYTLTLDTVDGAQNPQQYVASFTLSAADAQGFSPGSTTFASAMPPDMTGPTDQPMTQP